VDAVVLDGRGGIALETRPVPAPGPGEVLIAPGATGICGTDLHLIEGTYAAGRYPLVPGHEFAGTIAAVGSDVSALRDGDLVAADPNLSCGECRLCRMDAPNLCERIAALGINLPGSCAAYVLVPARVVVPLSPALDATTGALVEPLSCVLNAVKRAPGWQDAVMVVIGAGCIGLLATTVAIHLGAAEVHVVEPHALRRDRALALGARSAATAATELDLADRVDLVLDASGHPGAIASAIPLLRKRGRFIQMGVAHPEATIPVSPYAIYAKELTYLGANSCGSSFPAAAEMMVDLADRVRPLVTHTFPLARYADAVAAMRAPDAVKVQVA
jgi:2-desacetyl-2-hydroxyethyl bacteriochlorophyllide A dehydrogenase